MSAADRSMMVNDRFAMRCIAIGVFAVIVGQNWPNYRIYGVQLNVEQWLMLTASPFLFIQLIRHKCGQERVVFIIVWSIIIWLCMANAFIKDASYGNLRAIKNNMFVVASAYLYCCTIRFDTKGLLGITKAIVMATVFLLVLILPKMDYSSSMVRQIDGNEIVRASGHSYVWLGYISGVAGILCCLLASIGRGINKYLWICVMTFVLYGMFACGTRGVYIGLALCMFLAMFIRRINPQYIRAGCAVVIVIMALLPIYSEVVSDNIPNPVIASKYREGDARFIMFDNWLYSLQMRLQDWALISPKVLSVEGMVGIANYDRAMLETRALRHPHNMFLWMYVMGGIPALVLFCIMIMVIFIKAHGTIITHYHSTGGRVALALLCVFFLTVSVMISNSLVGAMPAMLGITIAMMECNARNYSILQMQNPADRNADMISKGGFVPGISSMMKSRGAQSIYR